MHMTFLYLPLAIGYAVWSSSSHRRHTSAVPADDGGAELPSSSRNEPRNSGGNRITSEEAGTCRISPLHSRTPRSTSPELVLSEAEGVLVGTASSTHYPRSPNELVVRASLDCARDRPLRTDSRNEEERSGSFRPLPPHPRCVVDLIPIIRVACWSGARGGKIPAVPGLVAREASALYQVS